MSSSIEAPMPADMSALAAATSRLSGDGAPRSTASAVARVRRARDPAADRCSPRCRRRCTEAPRLREALGGARACPRILIKRDDLTSLGLGGNKARKLEYLVADALAQGATTLDHDRRGPIEPRAHDRGGGRAWRDMRCVLVLTATTDNPSRRRQPACSTSCTAPTIRLVPSIDPMLAVGQDEAVVAEVVAEERAAGRVPYVIPVGGSSGIGVCGYIGGSAELVDQLSRRRRVAVAAVLRERIARHAGGPDIGREAVRRAVPGLWRRGQRRRAGKDRAREAHRQ